MLFVNDRVHIRKGTEFFAKIENEIVDYLAKHKGLEELQEERKRKLSAEKLDDSKPLEAILSNVFKHSSALSKIFLSGDRLSNPFKSEMVDTKDKVFEGKQYPTYFKFKKLDYGATLKRDAYMGQKSRIAFETDAANEYFNRKTNKGTYKLLIKGKNEEFIEIENKDVIYGLNLFNGLASLSIEIGTNYKVNEELHFILEVTDPMRLVEGSFINELVLTVKPEIEKTGGKNGNRVKPPDNKEGDKREKSGGIRFPKIFPVRETDWEKHQFDKYSAIKAYKSKKSEGGKDNVEFEFYINVDNIYLKHEVKDNIKDAKTIEKIFEYGMALVGISLIYDDQQNKEEDQKYEDIEERISDFSRAMAPILIPMINEFGDLNLKAELLEQLSD
jgi:hypothetical protein